MSDQYVPLQYPPRVITQWDRARRSFAWLRKAKYLWLALISYLLIAFAVYQYLQRTPVYASGHSLVLPGSGSSTKFNLEKVGEASQSTDSAFTPASYNPLVNYKEIMRSSAVTKETARILNVHPNDLRRPKVELTERTAILSIHTDANSAARAQEYGWALYHAFQHALDELRADEILRRDESIKAVLGKYKEQVETTRMAIVEFQQRALLVTPNQIDLATNALSAMDENLAALLARIQKSEDYVRKLALDLSISPALAGQAFLLQSDAEFRGYLKELDESAGLMAQYSSRFGKNHPKLVAQTQRYQTALSKLEGRAEELVGLTTLNGLTTLDLQASPKRAELLGKLIAESANHKGLLGEMASLKLSRDRANDHLRVLTREAAELERLQREHDLALAVYTSAAAKIKASQSDVFVSYPIIQMLSLPSLPEAPKSPNKTLAVAAGAMGCLSVTFALVLLWHRKYLIKVLLKKS